MMKRVIRFVAMSKRSEKGRPSFAKKSQYNQFIESTTDIKAAFKSETIAGLAVGFLGGHYRGYVPVKVVVSYEFDLQKQNEWPSEEVLFPQER